jgi:hypothetical protein
MTTLNVSRDAQQDISGESLTGRDGYIVGQALYWFIRTQQALPEHQFEWSNTEDAKLILLTHFPHVANIFERQDRHAGRKPASLSLEKYDPLLPDQLQAADVTNLEH